MQRISNLKLILTLVILASIISTIACGGTKLEKVTQIEDDFGQGYLSTTNIIAQAKETGVLKPEDVAFLKPILKTIGDSNLQVIQIMRNMSAQGELSVDEQARLISIVSFISDQLTSLNNEGGLRIRDKNKVLLFNAAVLAMQSAVTSFVVLITTVKKGK